MDRQLTRVSPRSRAFSLLEILIALALVGMISALLLIRCKTFVEAYQAKSATTQLMRQISFAQALSQVYQTEVLVSLSQKEHLIEFTMQSDDKIGLLDQKRLPLKKQFNSLIQMEWSDAHSDSKESQSIQLVFQSGQLIQPGVLSMKTKHHTYSITLGGDP